MRTVQLIYFFQVIVGMALIFSGYENLQNMEDMEYRFVEQYLGNWYIAPVFARVVIGLKWVLGSFLILNIKPKIWFLSLLFFIPVLSVYDLIWDFQDMVIESNYSSFGLDSNWVSILWISLTCVLAVYQVKTKKTSDFRISWVKYPMVITMLILPFILNAIFISDLYDSTPDYDISFKSSLIQSPVLSELAKTNGLVCFYSTSCPFCVKAARKIAVAQKRYSNFPDIYICFQGNEEGAKYFLEVANINADYKVLDTELYQKFSNFVYPQFQYVESDVVKYKWDGQTFNYSVMYSLSNNVMEE